MPTGAERVTDMAMRIIKSVHFDAAHYLDVADAAEAGRPYARMHGHSFRIDVEIAGEPDPATGWVADLGDIADALEALRADLDHRLLNEVPGLERPTLESIAAWAAARLKDQFPGLARVTVARPSVGEACVYDVS